MKNAIVLAAGKGTRMQSNKNKVMHEILRKPMIGMLVENLKKVDIDKIVVVTGHQKDEIEAYLGDSVDYAVQDEQKGTKRCGCESDTTQRRFRINPYSLW
ncbi:NTP transferase domain-containing protein [Erysipelothrix sp. D19-032]